MLMTQVNWKLGLLVCYYPIIWDTYILAGQDHPIPVNLLIRWKLPTRQTPAADRQKVARAPKQLPAHGLVTPNLLDKGRL